MAWNAVLDIHASKGLCFVLSFCIEWPPYPYAIFAKVHLTNSDTSAGFSPTEQHWEVVMASFWNWSCDFVPLWHCRAWRSHVEHIQACRSLAIFLPQILSHINMIFLAYLIIKCLLMMVEIITACSIFIVGIYHTYVNVLRLFSLILSILIHIWPFFKITFQEKAMFGAFIPTKMLCPNPFRMPLVKNLQQIRRAQKWWYFLCFCNTMYIL